MSILEGFALQLLDEDARGSDEQLNKFAAKFHQKIEANQDDNHFASSSYTRMVSLQVQITCASSPANSQSTSCAIIKGLTS
jgi:acetyl-CoA acetyltransferase